MVTAEMYFNKRMSYFSLLVFRRSMGGPLLHLMSHDDWITGARVNAAISFRLPAEGLEIFCNC